MSRPKNEIIGKVECPHKACTESCHVYRFRQRTEGRNRFAGKLYADCPVHGRYGADGKPASQEYILENSTIWGEGKKPVSTATAPDPAPDQITPPKGQQVPVLATPAAPEISSPVPAEPTPAAPARPRWWDALQPLIK